jgi:hypothetical protein
LGIDCRCRAYGICHNRDFYDSEKEKIQLLRQASPVFSFSNNQKQVAKAKNW